MMLYQYRRLREKGIEHLEELIVRGRIKFTSPSDFNDPFDCHPTILTDAPPDLPESAAVVMNSGLHQAMARLHGVVCLAPSATSMLMWSHYGDQHKGACVGFDSEILESQVQKNSSGFPAYEGPFKITYSRERPGIEGQSLFTTKAEDWAYEQEFRLISAKKEGTPEWGPGIWEIPQAAIKELVLGALVSPANESRARNLVAARIPIKRVSLHPRTYQLVFQDSDSQASPPQFGYVRTPNGDWIESRLGP